MKTRSKIGYMFLGMVFMLVLSVTVMPTLAASINKKLDAYYNDIRIIIDGELLTPMDANGKVVEPFIAEGTTYLPVRALARAFDKDIFWEHETQTVYVFSNPADDDVSDAENNSK